MSLYLGYAWIPLISGIVLLGGLIALLAAWAAEGHPQYKPNEGSIVYVSDVGAHLKPLFISPHALRCRLILKRFVPLPQPGSYSVRPLIDFIYIVAAWGRIL